MSLRSKIYCTSEFTVDFANVFYIRKYTGKRILVTKVSFLFYFSVDWRKQVAKQWLAFGHGDGFFT